VAITRALMNQCAGARGRADRHPTGRPASVRADAGGSSETGCVPADPIANWLVDASDGSICNRASSSISRRMPVRGWTRWSARRSPILPRMLPRMLPRLLPRPHYRSRGLTGPR
jgi:hypothetical protein